MCEVNVSDVENQEELNQRVRIAAFFGTLQAGFTDFHYLRNKWKANTEKDALLGIGMTGIGSGKVLNLDLQIAARLAESMNHVIADEIGINHAARITCIKPSGTTSCVLGTSSGIHAWHAPFYLRTIRFNKDEEIAQYLMSEHHELCEDDILRPKDTLCVRFPIKAPEGSIFRTETALDTLDRVKKFSIGWIKPGHLDGMNTHNVSATVSIDKNRKYSLGYGLEEGLRDMDEWEAVGRWMWDNKEFYNGISVLDYDGGTYHQSPFENISEEEYNKRIKSLKTLNLTNVQEDDDNVQFSLVSACAGGQCTIE